MSAVRSKDTKIEVAFRELLWRRGFRYRKNPAKYFGKPDLVLKKHTTVIFIDSCFWHGCKKHFGLPATRINFWRKKIERNRSRDKETNAFYKKQGWTIFRFWEHDIKKDLNRLVERTINKLMVTKCR